MTQPGPQNVQFDSTRYLTLYKTTQLCTLHCTEQLHQVPTLYNTTPPGTPCTIQPQQISFTVQYDSPRYPAIYSTSSQITLNCKVRLHHVHHTVHYNSTRYLTLSSTTPTDTQYCSVRLHQVPYTVHHNFTRYPTLYNTTPPSTLNCKL